MENRCVICGAIVPEGRQVCFCCEKGCKPKPEQNEKSERDQKCSLTQL